MHEYVDLKYSPSPDELVAEYYIEPAERVSIEKACEHIAAESSIGTWTDISTLSPELANKLKPHVFYIHKGFGARSGVVRIAYHPELFEAGNMPEILSSIAGNIFGMKAVKNLRLLDIKFPEKIISKFKGPKFGIGGIRKLMKVEKRPLCGTIVKPKVGLNEEQHARVSYDAWVGGLDIVKDDENLSSMSFNNFQKRVDLTLKWRDKAEKETGEKKMYMANITAETDEMKRRAAYIKKHGGEYFMVDVLTVGWSGLQTMRESNEKLKMVIHGHRAMHAALTRNPKHGISMLALAKCARLVGVDQLHIGTASVGKMHGSRVEELEVEEEIECLEMHPDAGSIVLSQNWYNIKPVLAVASGGLHAGMTEKLVKIMGNNIVAQYGGGVHWHPKGTRYGAMGVRQAIDAVSQGISLQEYAKTHQELKDALNKFGIAR